MGAIDETAEIVGRAVQMTGRKQVDAVISPAEATGEFRDRHHLDRRDAQIRQRRQVIHGGAPRALGREGADVQLVKHLPFETNAWPRLIGPCERRRIHNL